MRCLQFLLLFCLLSAALSTEEDQKNRRGKRSDDVSLGALQTLVQQQASTIDRQQADLTAHKNQLDGYKTQMDSMNSQLQTMQHQMGAQFQAMQQKLDVASKSVAFTARISYSHDNHNNGMALGAQQTVVFDNVVTNIGSAYNHNNGIFTTPVSGTYVFSLQQMSANSQGPVDLAIVKNGALLDLVYAEGSGDMNDQGSSQISTHLTTGDQVWVRQYSGNMIRGSWWTVFTGFLLHAD